MKSEQNAQFWVDRTECCMVFHWPCPPSSPAAVKLSGLLWRSSNTSLCETAAELWAIRILQSAGEPYSVASLLTYSYKVLLWAMMHWPGLHIEPTVNMEITFCSRRPEQTLTMLKPWSRTRVQSQWCNISHCKKVDFAKKEGKTMLIFGIHL